MDFHTKLIRFLIVIGLAIVFINEGDCSSQTIRLNIVRNNYQANLVVQESDQKNAKTIYTYRDISGVSWSYDSKFFAFIAHGNPLISDQGELLGDEGQKLVIMNSKYEIVDEISNARRYTWSPMENKLAIIAGEHTESGSEFTCKEIYVYDIKDKTRKIIPLIAYDLFWAKHDNRIYLDTYHSNDRIYSYDPTKEELNSTSYQGIYFSSDGTYYYNDPIEGGGEFKVMRTSNQTPVENPSFLKNSDWNAIGWVDASHIIIVSDWRNKKSYIVNLDTTLWIEYKDLQKDPYRVYLQQDSLGEAFKKKLNSVK